MASFAFFLWLGFSVNAGGEPSLLRHFALVVRGHGVVLARVFTNADYAVALAPLWALCVLVAIVARRGRGALLFLVVTSLAAWRITDAFQRYFARPRRLDWLVYHERSFSYPSSHAAISTCFYLAGGILLLRSRLPPPVRYGGLAAGVALWLGILWSRLALGAHYVTDLAGGVALGAAISAAGASLLRARGGAATP